MEDLTVSNMNPVYILGIQQQVSVDSASGRCRTGSTNTNFRPAHLARTDGVSHLHEMVWLDR